MRNLRIILASLLFGGLIGGGLMSLAIARADTDNAANAYAAVYGSAVCSTLDSYPSFAGIIGIIQAIEKDGLSAYQAGEVVGISVSEICPRHMGLIARFGSEFSGNGSVT